MEDEVLWLLRGLLRRLVRLLDVLEFYDLNKNEPLWRTADP